MFKQLFVLVFLTLLSTACGAKKGTTISGKITGGENMSIFLDAVSLVSNNSTLLSEKIGADGKFTFTLPEGIKKGVYRIKIGEQVADIIADGTEKQITLDANLTGLNEFNYTIKGSKLSEEYYKTVRSYIDKTMDIPTLTTYASTNSDPLIGFQIAVRLFTFRPDFIDLHKKVSARMTSTYPNLELTSQYANIIKQFDMQMSQEQAASTIQVGAMAPEIALPGPDGKVRKLSDYKGKVVLVDFWASWCGPCRKANPHVVEVYNKYKSKGFDVFSVSLDGIDSRTASRYPDPAQLKEAAEGQKQRWIQAIAQDNLLWDGHVSDLKKWESAPAGLYGVRSIPQTFLIGKDGKIAAINPRYDLEEQVLKFL